MIQLEAKKFDADYDDFKEFIKLHETFHYIYWRTGWQSNETKADEWALRKFIKKYGRPPNIPYDRVVK